MSSDQFKQAVDDLFAADDAARAAIEDEATKKAAHDQAVDEKVIAIQMRAAKRDSFIAAVQLAFPDA